MCLKIPLKSYRLNTTSMFQKQMKILKRKNNLLSKWLAQSLEKSVSFENTSDNFFGHNIIFNNVWSLNCWNTQTFKFNSFWQLLEARKSWFSRFSNNRYEKQGILRYPPVYTRLTYEPKEKRGKEKCLMHQERASPEWDS